MKQCSKCGEVKPLTEFWNRRRGRVEKQSRCKDCCKTHVREWSKRPHAREQRRIQAKAWYGTEVGRASKAASVRRHRFKKLYGLSPEDYDAMFESQEGRCAICRQEPQDKMLAVDHDHDTGRVRGLLCWPCNAAIGGFKDDPWIMARAIEYLSAA